MGGTPDTRALAAEIDAEFSAELRKEERTVEALLFALGRSVSVTEIATALNTGEKPARDAAERLCESYRERQGGILIERLEDRYQMCTNPSEFSALIRVAKQPKKPVLTDVVMETLAIIAYKQPITKAEIERIRGVKSDHAVNRLVEYELVYEAGRLDAPGRPALFATSEEFLRRFGVQSLAELPALPPEAEKAIETEVSEEIADVLGSDEQEDDTEEHTEKNAEEHTEEHTEEYTDCAEETAEQTGSPAIEGLRFASAPLSEPEVAETVNTAFKLPENDMAATEEDGEEGSGPESETQESDREEKAPETDKVEGSRETVPEPDAVTDAEPQQREDDSSEEEWLEQLLYETETEEEKASAAPEEIPEEGSESTEDANAGSPES